MSTQADLPSFVEQRDDPLKINEEYTNFLYLQEGMIVPETNYSLPGRGNT
jgi:hypothetical protein